MAGFAEQSPGEGQRIGVIFPLLLHYSKVFHLPLPQPDSDFPEKTAIEGELASAVHHQGDRSQDEYDERSVSGKKIAPS